MYTWWVNGWLYGSSYFKRAAEVETNPLPSPILAVQLFRAIFSCIATNKEVHRVIETINDGPLYLLGAFTSIATLRGKGANYQIRVATLLITE